MSFTTPIFIPLATGLDLSKEAMLGPPELVVAKDVDQRDGSWTTDVSGGAGGTGGAGPPAFGAGGDGADGYAVEIE